MAHNDPFITVIYGNSKPQRGKRDDPASPVPMVKLIANQPCDREWAANKVVWLTQPKRSPRHSGYGMPFTRKVKAANPGCLAFPWSAETAEPLSAQSIPVFKCGSLPVLAARRPCARTETNTASLKGMAALRGKSIVEVLELGHHRPVDHRRPKTGIPASLAASNWPLVVV